MHGSELPDQAHVCYAESSEALGLQPPIPSGSQRSIRERVMKYLGNCKQARPRIGSLSNKFIAHIQGHTRADAAFSPYVQQLSGPTLFPHA